MSGQDGCSPSVGYSGASSFESGPVGGGAEHRHHHGGAARRALDGQVAKDLGVTPQALWKARQGGQSVAQLAATSGSAVQVTSDVTAAFTQRLQARASHLPADQAQQLEQNLPAIVAHMVDRYMNATPEGAASTPVPSDVQSSDASTAAP